MLDFPEITEAPAAAPAPQPAAAEQTRAITASIGVVQGEVAKFDQIAAGLKAIEDAHPKNVIVAAAEAAAIRRQAEELAAREAAVRAEAETRRQTEELAAQRAESDRLEALAVANRERLAREAQAEAAAAVGVVASPAQCPPPAAMLQDECRDLSIALASKPDSMQHARDAAQAITEETQKAAQTSARDAMRTAMNEADDIDILAEYSRTDGRREWVTVGTWLRPGEVVAHMADPRSRKEVQ